MWAIYLCPLGDLKSSTSEVWGGCVGQQEEMPQMDLSPVGLAVGLAEIPKPKEY